MTSESQILSADRASQITPSEAGRRADDLMQLAQMLVQSVGALADGDTLNEILSKILRGAVAATGASAGAVLRRIGETSEFAFELIAQNDVLLSGQEQFEHPFNVQVRKVSRIDPEGYFGSLAAGEVLWRLAEDTQAGR